MTVDESSSQDATLIDDDLVAALGFEPVTGVEDSDDAAQAESNGHVATATDLDDPVDHAADGETSSLDAVNGFGIDALDDARANGSTDDLMVEDSVVEDSVVDEADTPIEADTSAEVGSAEPDDVIDLDALDAMPVDDDVVEVDVVEVDVVAVDLDDPSRVELDESSAVDEAAVDEAAADKVAVDEVELDDAPADEAADDLDRALDLDSSSDDAPAVELAEADDVFAASHSGIDAAVVDELISDGAPVAERIDDATLEHISAAPTLDEPVLGESLTVDDAVGAAAVPATTAAVAEAAPVKRARKLRARKSRRVIRHIDPWSVLTFSVLFHMVVFAALLLSSVLVWNAAIASGMVENVESFIQELGDYETFEINADVMFRAAIVIAGMLTLASSVLVVLLTVVFNLISDLVGGIRVTVIEEETVRVPIDTNRSGRRSLGSILE